MSELIYYLVPALLVLVSIKLHLRGVRKKSCAHAEILREAVETGLTEPPSLHPVVDLSICIGSGACVRACPEKALGVINGKGTLINPSHCIGHGACAPSCPVGAIKLVFGTAKRGMDIPQVTPEFETNVPGIFIAGELGGMGLIRNAIKQGTQAVGTIVKRPRSNAEFDLVIIGAGPAGISASLAAKEAGLRYVTVEQEDSLGGTTYHYPRNKLVMTAPMKLPLVGEIKVREVSKEELMEIWRGVLDKAQPNVRFSERMEEIIQEDDGFTVRTSKDRYRTGNILLAIGRRGTPRKLGAEGEDQPKVVYRLIEADQYRGQHVLVVGGGDSALEAALDISAEPDTTVTLCYRGKAFDRVKPKNRARLEEAVAGQRIQQIMETTVKKIEADKVILAKGDEAIELPNDAIIVCAGGELPTPMLKKIGIQVDARYGT
ncbi:FAD-dependent pyridine nucleotide-disulfide oxidoreductase [Sulfuricella denitrificans skB26]|uniref:FAD-dependent pyridine nucleotide-disulfide oxidoreductase n=1 Tax=Sulfuricella denitrificans (strain DSM 22764 / NBRC 105220 / skB26) TaxID=1163617 RepID=S6B2C2_SULDS|nr:NAD(P)-binding domain-containing protein [Sulfuricella denitrificans]BAN34807.1 FAD-dependent pyridine nucleotide-disulfide oxidoreductase [Sulfuricella denitrificans skB26]